MHAAIFKIVMMVSICQSHMDKLESIAQRYNTTVQLIIELCIQRAVNKDNIIEDYIKEIEAIENQVPYY